MFERVFAILLREGVSWKVVGSEVDLLLLNNGIYGLSQAGKFLTIYPSDDAQAVRLARALDEATLGARGPRIPTDRRLNPHSVVHYRYGAFVDIGQAPRPDMPPYLRGTLLDCRGLLIDDRRGATYGTPPAGVLDPFEAASLYVPPPSRSPPFAGRYLIVEPLGSSACGGTFLAIDLDADPPRRCVLKEFRAWAGGDEQGLFAPDWGSREAALLRRHGGTARMPQCFDEFEVDEDHFLAIEYVEGVTLAAMVYSAREKEQALGIQDIICIAENLLVAISDIHDVDVICRDVSPKNVVVSGSHQVRLIDFGASFDLATGEVAPSERGTFAYCAPEQWKGLVPDVRDDVFSWAAVAFELLTFAHPPRDGVVEAGDVLARRPDCPAGLAELVSSCLGARGRRQPTAAAALEALRSLRHDTGSAQEGRAKRSRSSQPLALSATQALEEAKRIGDHLLETRIDVDGGTCWSSHVDGERYCSADLYHGAAGIAMFLARLGRATDVAAYADAARAAIRWTAGEAWAHPRALQGLYVGEVGCGWSYLCVSRLLGERSYVSLADLHWRRIRGIAVEDASLGEGLAGRLLLIVNLAQATGDCSYAEEGRRTLARLIEASRRERKTPAQGATLLRRPRPFLGLAHGLAGHGYAMLECWRHTRDPAALEEALTIGGELLSARRSGEAESSWGLRAADAGSDMAAQCHGSVGIGQFLARLGRATGENGFIDAVLQAARVAGAALEGRASIGLCHGQAGIGSVALDCLALSGASEFAEQAGRCGALLARRLEERRRRNDALSSRPELMNGLSGVGWFLLRMSAPEFGEDPILGGVSEFARAAAPEHSFQKPAPDARTSQSVMASSA
ncbi:lanthionine synthetase LanC family protein [Sphingomonas sp. BK580]|uniref:lanthionine synthetase LanC family protein n=1 Tax=Sphingomonas sp. BK580 TaxID=2586972 RepID=UPI0016082A20|nr:lanthionine synthetase LanC family protein [Sphingomonas sp. BK580]MBB3692004.1 hypothetical protein [Sphingomonas sp. BK580]